MNKSHCASSGSAIINFVLCVPVCFCVLFFSIELVSECFINEYFKLILYRNLREVILSANQNEKDTINKNKLLNMFKRDALVGNLKISILNYKNNKNTYSGVVYLRKKQGLIYRRKYLFEYVR